MIILVDAMGGDHAPEAIVHGCLDAINEKEGFDIVLIGDRPRIEQIISQRNFKNDRLKIHHTTEVITNEDTPTKAIRRKKDASMVVGFKLLKEKKGDVFLSAGNSGALMAGGLFILGRIKGIDRPSLPAIVPTKKGKALIIDAGLNTVCKPINLLQFGIMGSIYMKELFGIENPKVGLINVGAEETKGNDLTKQAHALLKDSQVNFVGNIEGKDVNQGNVDVIVCDGFVGNVALKLLEGAASFFFSSVKAIMMKRLSSKIAALFLKKDLKNFAKSVDADEDGGAPLLGVDGLAIKSHGSSQARTIKNVIIKRAYTLANTSILSQLHDEFKNVEVEEIEE